MSRLLRRQTGVSLVEVILGMVVAVAMMLYMGKMQSITSGEMRAKLAAEAMQSLHNAAFQHFLSNRSGILAAIKTNTTPGDFCQVGADPLTGTGGTVARTATTCAIDVNWLKWKQALPAEYRATNPYHQKLQVVYRLANAVAEDFEMLIIGGANGGNEMVASIDELGVAAELMGGNGGFVPPADVGSCLYNGVTKQACGYSGGWKIDLANYVAAPVTSVPGSVASYVFIPKAAATSGGAAAATLKVVTEGDACTATETDNTGINAAYDRILTCSGGTWKYLKKHALNQAAEGAACNAANEGDIAKDANGLVLSCQAGVWNRDPATRCAAGYVYTGSSCQAITSYASSLPSSAVILYPVLYACPSGFTMIDSAFTLGGGSTWYTTCRKN